MTLRLGEQTRSGQSVAALGHWQHATTVKEKVGFARGRSKRCPHPWLVAPLAHTHRLHCALHNRPVSRAGSGSPLLPPMAPRGASGARPSPRRVSRRLSDSPSSRGSRADSGTNSPQGSSPIIAPLSNRRRTKRTHSTPAALALRRERLVAEPEPTLELSSVSELCKSAKKLKIDTLLEPTTTLLQDRPAGSGDDAKARPPSPTLNVPGYEVGRTIGTGSFGRVKLARRGGRGPELVIKLMPKTRMNDLRRVDQMFAEMFILTSLRHANVIQLYEVINLSRHIILVMEYAEGGELRKLIERNTYLSETFACELFTQILEGLIYCHRLKVIHRDLKLENILLDARGRIKIVDFGLSERLLRDQKLGEVCGTPLYMSPELYRGEQYDGATDVWSLGVVLYAMVCGFLPFSGNNIKEVKAKVNGGFYTIPAFLSQTLRDLIAGALTVNSRRRLTLEAIQNSRWVLSTPLSSCSSGSPLGSPATLQRTGSAASAGSGESTPSGAAPEERLTYAQLLKIRSQCITEADAALARKTRADKIASRSRGTRQSRTLSQSPVGHAKRGNRSPAGGPETTPRRGSPSHFLLSQHANTVHTTNPVSGHHRRDSSGSSRVPGRKPRRSLNVNTRNRWKSPTLQRRGSMTPKPSSTTRWSRGTRADSKASRTNPNTPTN